MKILNLILFYYFNNIFTINFFNQKDNYECSKDLMNSYGLTGLDFFNNKNYLCKNIKKNCCTLSDQLAIYDKVIQLKNSSEKENLDLIKQLEDFFSNKDQLLKLDFNKIKNDILKNSNKDEEKEIITLLGDIESDKIKLNSDIVDIYKKNQKYKTLYKMDYYININKETNLFNKDFLNSLTKEDIELLHDYGVRVKTKKLKNKAVEEKIIDFDKKVDKVHFLIKNNKNLQKELFYYDYFKNNKSFWKEIKHIFDIKINSINDYYSLIKINYSNFYNFIDIMNQNFFCNVCDFDFLKYINFDKKTINLHELTCDNLVTRYLYISQIKIKIMPYIIKLKLIMSIYLNNNYENNFDFEYYEDIINKCFNSLNGSTLLTESCLNFCKFYRVNYKNDIFFEDSKFYEEFNEMFKNFIIKYNTGSFRVLETKNKKKDNEYYKKRIKDLLKKDNDEKYFKDLRKKEKIEINNLSNFKIKQISKTISQDNKLIGLSYNNPVIQVIPLCKKPINLAEFDINYSIIGYRIFQNLNWINYDKNIYKKIKSLIKINSESANIEKPVDISKDIKSLISTLDLSDIFKFSNYINMNFLHITSKIDYIIENDDIYLKYSKLIYKANKYKKVNNIINGKFANKIFEQQKKSFIKKVLISLLLMSLIL